MLDSPGLGRRALVFLMIAMMVGPVVSSPSWAASPVTITMKTSVHGEILDLTILAVFPIAVQFTVKNPAAGASYFWDFGDGTNSTNPAPSHTYNSPFVYDISLHLAFTNGTATSGTVKFAVMDQKGPNGAIAVFPPSGTYGFVPVKIAGAYFPLGKQASLLMNGSLLTNVKADDGGIWEFDLSSALPASPNGTKFVFSTNPPSLTRIFTTIEGIRATPGSAGVGDSVLVEGRSYPASSSVQVYIDGVNLGTTDTDDTGSFEAGMTIPAAPALAGGGAFQYTTIPPVLGTQSTLDVTGFSVTSGLASWWWLILVAIGAVLIYFFVIRPARSGSRRNIPIPTS